MRCWTRSATRTSLRSASCSTPRQAARDRRRGQPLRRPVRGRGRLGLGRRALRLARVRAQDGERVPRARAGPGVRRPREGGRDGQPAGAVRRRLRARAELHRGDGARRRVRLRGARHRRRQGARDPRRGGHRDGPQPPQLRLARAALRHRRVGDPQGLHARLPRPGGVRRRDDGRAVGDPARARLRRVARPVVLDRPRRGAGDVAHAGGGQGPRAECGPRRLRLGQGPGEYKPAQGRCPNAATTSWSSAGGSSSPARSTCAGCRRPERPGSSCAAAPPTRRPRPTSAWTPCSPRTATRSRSCTA